MNIPEIYLVEPYNAYAPKGRKKHWHEIVEEQALLAKIIAEQQALQEAQYSKTLPQNSPATATPTIGGTPQAGAGGVPVTTFFNPGADLVNFSFTPTGGVAPVTIVFTNLTTTPEEDIFLWEFGDGTTSSLAYPTHVYPTGSSAASFSCSLQTSNSVTFAPGTRSAYQYISASIPTVTAAFTFTTTSIYPPHSASFTNTSTNNSQTPTTTYFWRFVNGTIITTSSLASPSIRVDSGSFTASLQATGSYNISSSYTQSFYAPIPTLTAGFTTRSFGFGGVEDSYMEPVSMSYTSSTAYAGNGTLTYLWNFGTGSITSTEFGTVAGTASTVGPHFRADYEPLDGGYTASLQVTESIYGITSNYTRSFYVST